MPETGERLRILTWNVHGDYLYHLSHLPHDFYLPVKPGRPEGYGGRTRAFPWPDNVHEISADEARYERFDAVLYQSHRNWLVDQHEILSEEQLHGPRVYLEHDPPREHPTDTRHPVRDPEVPIVQVTPFNALMWDTGANPVSIIDHGVVAPDLPLYTGSLQKGISVVNDMPLRGRRLGADVLDRVRQDVPIDLAGTDPPSKGELGAVPYAELPAFVSRYRFFFDPARYTSLALSVCEAMAAGMPIVGLATTEMSVAVRNGETGWVETDLDLLVEHMRDLLHFPDEAARLGRNAREYALERFGMGRFTEEWDALLQSVAAVPVLA